MKVTVSLLPTNRAVLPSTEVAVVIDVLRATSVMTTALANGAKQIITCEEVAEAEMMAEIVGKQPLLCGERSCQPIPGFDLGNSPSEYSPQIVDDRTLVLTTTNGTHAIAAAEPAQRVVAASFLNLQAVVQSLIAAQHVHLICAGTNGAVTAEDSLLAGAIVRALAEHEELEHDSDETILCSQLWLSYFGSHADVTSSSLENLLSQSQGGRNLLQKGYRGDLGLCSQIDSIQVVPQRISISPSTFALPAINGTA